MQPPLNDDSKSFWQHIHTQRKKHPFWCRTGRLEPRPELVDKRIYGHFYRLGYEEFGYWGFPTQEKRNSFLRAYNADLWSPT